MRLLLLVVALGLCAAVNSRPSKSKLEIVTLSRNSSYRLKVVFCFFSGKDVLLEVRGMAVCLPKLLNYRETVAKHQLAYGCDFNNN